MRQILTLVCCFSILGSITARTITILDNTSKEDISTFSTTRKIISKSNKIDYEIVALGYQTDTIPLNQLSDTVELIPSPSLQLAKYENSHSEALLSVIRKSLEISIQHMPDEYNQRGRYLESYFYADGKKKSDYLVSSEFVTENTTSEMKIKELKNEITTNYGLNYGLVNNLRLSLFGLVSFLHESLNNDVIDYEKDDNKERDIVNLKQPSVVRLDNQFFIDHKFLFHKAFLEKSDTIIAINFKLKESVKEEEGPYFPDHEGTVYISLKTGLIRQFRSWNFDSKSSNYEEILTYNIDAPNYFLSSVKKRLEGYVKGTEEFIYTILQIDSISAGDDFQELDDDDLAPKSEDYVKRLYKEKLKQNETLLQPNKN